jgi:hypothetical protein
LHVAVTGRRKECGGDLLAPFLEESGTGPILTNWGTGAGPGKGGRRKRDRAGESGTGPILIN